MAGYKRWAWRTRGTRVDRSRALGAAQPAVHMAADPDPMAGTARPASTAARLPMTPGGMIDFNAGTRYDGRVPGIVDGASEDHARDQAHDVDTGTVDARTRRPPRSTAGTAYATERQTIEPSKHSGSRVANIRGDNALPENNPDGYPLGSRNRRWVDRRMTPSRLVHHDRPVPFHGAALPVQSDSPGGIYTSPFPTGIAARRKFTTSPLTRRPPASPETLYTQAPAEYVGTGQFWKGF